MMYIYVWNSPDIVHPHLALTVFSQYMYMNIIGFTESTGEWLLLLCQHFGVVYIFLCFFYAAAFFILLIFVYFCIFQFCFPAALLHYYTILMANNMNCKIILQMFTQGIFSQIITTT